MLRRQMVALRDLERSIQRDGVDGAIAMGVKWGDPRRQASEAVRVARMNTPHGCWRMPRLRPSSGPRAWAHAARRETRGYFERQEAAAAGVLPRRLVDAESEVWLDVSRDALEARMGLTARGLSSIGHVLALRSPQARYGGVPPQYNVEQPSGPQVVEAGEPVLKIVWDGFAPNGQTEALEPVDGVTTIPAPVRCRLCPDDAVDMPQLEMVCAHGTLPWPPAPLLRVELDPKTHTTLLSDEPRPLGLLDEADYLASRPGHEASVSFIAPMLARLSNGRDGAAAGELAHTACTAVLALSSTIREELHARTKDAIKKAREVHTPPSSYAATRRWRNTEEEAW